MIKNNCDKYFIIRTGCVYGSNPSRGKGTNFVLEIVRKGREESSIDVVANYMVSPTWTMQLAKNLLHLLRTEEYGTYHMTALGDCAYYDFAKLIIEELRLPAKILPVNKAVSSRPQYPLLDNKNLEVIRLNKMDFWDNALRRFLLNFDAA